MKTRAVASLLLAGSLAVGLSGCNFFSPQNTLMIYSPSDGVQADVGPLAVRNAMLLSEDGERATLVLTAINTTPETETLTVSYESDSPEAIGGRATLEISVPSQTIVTTSGAGSEQVLVLEGLDVVPGALFPLYLQSGTDEGVELPTPILSSTLEEYQDLMPRAPLPAVETPAAPTPIPTPEVGTLPEDVGSDEISPESVEDQPAG